ncbi:MAG: 4Fe-4S dicluster domain-containing protein [Acidobacteriales bacterium]|nr:4Fe-4S dicluster domain-containing protein [Terriglobales bacterium]
MPGLVQIESKHSNFATLDRPTWEMYSTCIHCGLCLNHCPTYRVLGTEMDSPRGRIYQVLQVDAGRLAIGDSFVTHIDRCLGCLACETACPSGVPYGHIVERARAQIEQHIRRPLLTRMARWYFFQKALRDFHTLSRTAKLLRWYQRSGLRTVVRKSGVLRMLGLAEIERLAPKIDDEFFFSEIGTLVPAEGERRGIVAFHAGCITNVAFAGLNRATVRVLSKNGFDVYIVPRQRCCGALHAHSGLREDARLLARRNIRAMKDAARDFDAIITNSAGCGSHMKDYVDLLSDDPEYREAAVSFAARTRDVTEFLAQVGLREPRRRATGKVTYQDPCHLLNAQRIRQAPRDLLRAAGLEIAELPHSDQCCGSAGTYNLTQNHLSRQLLAAKMKDVQTVAHDVHTVVTANTGCMIQMRAGLASRGIDLPVRHVVEVLNDCF